MEWKKFKPLFRFIKPYWKILLLAIFCLLLYTAMNLAAPWMVRNLIDTVTRGMGEQVNFDRINMLALAIVIIYILRAVAQFGRNYVAHYAAWEILEDIRQYFYDHIQELSLKFFQDKQTGELMSRVVNDTRNFERLLAHAIPTVISNVGIIVGISAILFSMNVKLAFLTLIPIPVLVGAVLKFSRISRPLFKKAQEEVADVNAILQDNFSGIKEIKAFTQEDYESKQAGKRITAYTRAILKALKVSAIYQPSIQFISGTGTVIVIFFGGRLALTGEIPMADLVAFLLYIRMFYQPITQLGRINEGLQQALASAERVIEILNVEPQIVDNPQAEVLKEVEGEIVFDKVDFEYDEDNPVLEDISFTVDPGEKVALVGPTGVGKTTIIRLIPRFYEPQSGDILIDGKDIKDITISSLRKNISMVLQDVFLFNGTIKDNIVYGNNEAGEDEVITAAKTANAHEFIKDLAEGYDTHVGERGVKLSGGQKQRISIARAVLKDAPILILDEATSAVDTETENLIQEALDKLMEDKTTIMIAHRLSTIQDADQILVLEKGRIIERGNHNKLLEAGGLYAQLCQTQKTTDRLVL